MNRKFIVLIFPFLLALAFFLNGNANQPDVFEIVVKGRLEELKGYIKNGGDPNEVNSDGKSLLFLSIENDRFKTYEYLLRSGANPNFRNSSAEPAEGIVLMQKAAETLDSRYLKYAINYGGDPNSENSYGRPVLFDALISLENTKVLVNNGAEKNVIGKNGNTPVHAAALITNFDIVYFLLNEGAVTTTKNNFGKTLIDTIYNYGDAGINPTTDQYIYFTKVLEILDIEKESIPQHN